MPSATSLLLIPTEVVKIQIEIQEKGESEKSEELQITEALTSLFFRYMYICILLQDAA